MADMRYTKQENKTNTTNDNTINSSKHNNDKRNNLVGNNSKNGYENNIVIITTIWRNLKMA